MVYLFHDEMFMAKQVRLNNNYFTYLDFTFYTKGRGVDLMSLEWERLFLKILDRHVPIRQRKVRNNYAPHINSELRRKMFLRDYYKKKHRFTRSENDWQQYKKLRNAVDIENAKTKTDYFTQKLVEANNDIKETWKILNSALGKRSKTTTV